ncbi:hypothetical protein K7X08_023723 [Anisodus acutangulus]|uniref:Uncharacterized protein n=1 Tax=Anisodus acutangulus TaxID=402998 RepID=A0A9Q1LA77_9SOLA|nr:hypothetical protein K7X08_023723 [Anisodus acutangulus]
MAAAMDFWNSTTTTVDLNLSSDPISTSGGELMEALEPFMKSASSSPSTYMLRGDFARLNFPHLRHNGDFEEYNPLHSSVDAKLKDICLNLAQGKSIDSKKKKTKGSDRVGSAEEVTMKMEEDESKVMEGGSESDRSGSGSGGLSPVTDLAFPEFTEEESTWNMSEDFLLQKYPSHEIDWAAL